MKPAVAFLLAVSVSFLFPIEAQEENNQPRQSNEAQIVQRHKASVGIEPTVIAGSPANERVAIVGDAEGNLSRIDLSKTSPEVTTVVSGCIITAIGFLDDGGQSAIAKAECEDGQSTATLLTNDGGFEWKMLGVSAAAQSCQIFFILPPFTNIYSASGENGYANLYTQGACPAIPITSTASFITNIRRSSSIITFTVARNDGFSNRVGFIVAGSSWVKLVQAGTGTQQPFPHWVAAPYGLSISKSAQPVNTTINAGNGVEWQATSDSLWLTVKTFLGVGMGNGTLAMSASANTTGRTRTARITVTGNSYGPVTFNVTQQ